MKREKTFFIIDDLAFELDQPEITVNRIKVTQVKFENQEYKALREHFDENFYNIEKGPDGWIISEKE